MNNKCWQFHTMWEHVDNVITADFACLDADQVCMLHAIRRQMMA